MAKFIGVFMLLAAAACSAAKTACPYRAGYQAFPDTQWGGSTSHGSMTTTTRASMAAAETACSSDSSCAGFNNLGEIVAGIINNLSTQIGTCTYLKGVCPQKAGFTVYNHTIFVLEHSNEAINSGNANGVETACHANSKCPGFTQPAPLSSGHSSGSGGSIFGTHGGIIGLEFKQNQCTYLKNSLPGVACPPKYGYSNMYQSTAVGAGGNQGSAWGPMPGDAAAAEEACKVNPKCTAWDTEGLIHIGGVRVLDPRTSGSCTYIKDPCPPMAGFTAHPDLTDDTTPVASRDKTLCLADTYKKCLYDNTCKGFDWMRRFWSSKPNPATSRSAMCTYVRAAGF